ncbi:MAG: hypothetical protein J3Q66DRAFT_334090 [Benniella sp.]|nr:MAG: hypothetical protein J3Q66DRAFT_334090 [Benniella sp.]
MTSHATDLSELRQRIARHLDLATLKACSLVCKAWHLDFDPFLWECFTYQAPKRRIEAPEEFAAWLDITSKKAHLFRHIPDRLTKKSMPPEIRDILLDRCHGLITIEVSIVYGREPDTVRYWEGTLRPLIEQNKTSLQRLLLREYEPISVTSLQLPSLLAGLPHLQSFDLLQELTLEDLLPILEACPNSLERLTLLIQRSTQRRRLATDTAPFRLKHLSIQGNCEDGALAEILSRVAIHSLESLLIQATIDDQFFLPMTPTLKDMLSRLTDLDIRRLEPNFVKAFLMLLAAIPPHQLRNVRSDAMGTECVAMLIQEQHRSLESLRVSFQWGHSRALGDILATCRKLKNLTFRSEPLIDIRTWIDPQRPWVCTELEVFEGHFGLPPVPRPSDSNMIDAEHSEQKQEDDDENVATTDQVENIFMERLGQLTKLRRLAQGFGVWRHFAYSSMRDMNKNVMAWTLSSGLRHLKDLVNLRWLEFFDENLPASIGIPELMFMKHRWHNLQGLACYRIDAIEIEEWLATEWPELEVKLRYGVVAYK